jgi:hypothetical protein
MGEPMTITPIDFDRGVKFKVKASTESERVLLIACVDGDVLVSDDDTGFILTLKVSN